MKNENKVIKEFVDSCFAEEQTLSTKLNGTIRDSSAELKAGCDVIELEVGDTVPAELQELFDKSSPRAWGNW